MIADIVAWGVLFGYCVMASVSYHLMLDRNAFCHCQEKFRLGTYSKAPSLDGHYAGCDARMARFGASLFWPVWAPVYIGRLIASLVGRKERRKAELDRRISLREVELGIGAEPGC